jgi:hypothetical protein
MTEFLQALIQMPTAIFSLLLAFVVAYWLLVIVGALDLDVSDLDVDLSDASGTADSLAALGLKDVPLPVWLSVFVLVGWTLTILGVHFLTSGPLGAWAVFAVAAVLGVVLASVASRPLAPLFKTHPAIEHRALVGRTCTITTLRVDETFGQALVDDGAAGLLVQVRCQESGELERGSQALIFDYNPDEGFFHVARFEDRA